MHDTFAARLNRLFEQSARPTNNVVVAQALADRGCPISTPYLSQLRTGVRKTPGDNYIFALAEHFGVSAEYFFSPTDHYRPGDLLFVADAAVIAAISDGPIHCLLTTAHGLPETSVELLIAFADRLRLAERLPLQMADGMSPPGAFL